MFAFAFLNWNITVTCNGGTRASDIHRLTPSLFFYLLLLWNLWHELAIYCSRYFSYPWKISHPLERLLYASSRWFHHKQEFPYTTDFYSRFSHKGLVVSFCLNARCSLKLWVFLFHSLKQPRPPRVSKMNGNDDMDEELKAAIAASLEDFQGSAHSRDPTSSKKHNVVDLTADSDDGDEVEEIFPKSRSVIGSETEDGDDYDEDLERAIQISMQGAPEKVEKSDGNEIVQMSTQKEDSPKPISVKNDKKPSPQAQKEEQPTQEQKPSFPGILGLDRKKMEEERLARLMKRKIDTSPDRREAKQSRTESPKGKRAGIKSPHKSPTPKPEPRKEQPKARSVDTPTSTPSVQFPAGVIKKTWNANARRIGNDIKINEVFQASDLELAVLSSFMWDMDWLFSNLDTKKTRFLLIMQAKEESTVGHLHLTRWNLLTVK